ncbi:serine hydrolase domain-containing protein [Streptosporangium sp. KLBMP 9127]|nr:beta-lactamase family protein [Streptosporangium sp. KLBMP 9127]
MRKSLAILAAMLPIVAACTAAPGGPRRGPVASGAAVRCDQLLDEAFSAWAKAGFSGSIAISTGGTFDCLAGYGSADDATGAPNTADTVFDIGSVTKAFTAAAVLDLADAGRLSLDDRAGEILPALRGAAAKATIEQLLLHTSGINGSHGDDYRPLGRDAAIAAISGLEPAFEPGSTHLYSNAGYTLLALIVEKVSGTSYRDHMAAKILPLPGGHTAGGFWNGEPAAPGSRAVGYHDDGRTGRRGDFPGPHWGIDGNGGLAMTARDLASWTHLLFTGELVSPKSVKAVTGPGFPLGDGRSETAGWVAFDDSVYGKPFLTTAGGGGDVGHNAVVVWVPEQRQVIVIMSNRPKVTAEELLKAVGPSLVAGDPLPTPAAPARGADPAAIVGTYKPDEGGSFEVTATGNRLAISASGADAVGALFPPRGAVRPGDLRDHERRVLTLLSGQSQEGRKERDALESAFGQISGVALAGTVISHGEPRTYVTVATGKRSITGWYSVNAAGGVNAVEIPAKGPALPFVPAGDDRYRPDDPTGTGPEVTVAFDAGRMTISGPGGTTVARSAG